MRFVECLTRLAVLLAVVPVVARAEPVTFSWTGTVASSTGSPASGSAVPVSITLDRSYPADPNTTNPKLEATYSGGSGSPSGRSPILAATINGANALGWFDTVHVQKNLGGLSQISIESALPQCCRSFKMVFSTTMKGVVKSVAIPKTLFPANFQSSAFTVTYTRSDTFDGSLK